MEYLMGIKGRDFVIVAGDTSATQQIIAIKHDEDKLVPIDSHKLMCLSGEPGDRVHFSEFILANTRLYALRNDKTLSTRAVANFTRNELATALRKGPYSTNLLIAGWDEKTGPSLYWMDYLATMHSMNIAGTGYGSYFVLSMLDRLWHPDLTQDEAVELMEKGIEEVRRRLVVAPPSFVIKVVDKDGIRTVKQIRAVS
ncbi:g39 [Coccomyxa viridis]|uniref:Proteasome subunit beta n=1 Tax=Coccomyxa viridis TaxID=1274662 RepID=A0ABP1FF06_9CHLO